MIGFKLNKELARYLHGLPNTANKPASPAPLSSSPTYRLRIRDRLSPEDITELVRDFKAGARKRQLAVRYGTGLGSVKRILRDSGAKRRLWKDRRK